MIRHSCHGQRLLPARVETTGQHAYFSVEKYCWRLFNLASLNISEKVKFAKFAKYKGTLNIRDLQYFRIYLIMFVVVVVIVVISIIYLF